jgi:hypothetical protein
MGQSIEEGGPAGQVEAGQPSPVARQGQAVENPDEQEDLPLKCRRPCGQGIGDDPLQFVPLGRAAPGNLRHECDGERLEGLANGGQGGMRHDQESIRRPEATPDTAGDGRPQGIPLQHPDEGRDDIVNSGRLAGFVCIVAVVAAVPAHGQDPLVRQVPEGPLIVQTLDAVTGRPLGFAVVSMTSPKVESFTDEGGQLRLPRLARGRHTLRVRQLGYSPVELELEVGNGPAVAQVEVWLTPRPLELPTLVAQACVAPEDLDAPTRLVLDEASENVRRLMLLQRSYPFVAQYQRARRIRDRTGADVAVVVDTFSAASTASPWYRPGRAIVQWQRGQWDVAYFTIEAVLSKDFRKSHCFWIAGSEVGPGGRHIRLAFAPVASLKGPDWEGELLLDTTGVLRSSLARLVVYRPRAGWPTAAECRVRYDEHATSLLTEGRLDCGVIGAGPDYLENQETWNLVCRTFRREVPIPGLVQCPVATSP